MDPTRQKAVCRPGSRVEREILDDPLARSCLQGPPNREVGSESEDGSGRDVAGLEVEEGPVKPDTAEKQSLPGACRRSWPHRHAEVRTCPVLGPRTVRSQPCVMRNNQVWSFVKGAGDTPTATRTGGAFGSRTPPQQHWAVRCPAQLWLPHICLLRELFGPHLLWRPHVLRGVQGMEPQDGRTSGPLVPSHLPE